MMLGTFIDKATTLFDRRFLLAWWFPTLVTSSVGFLLYSWPMNWKPLEQYFSALQSGTFSTQLLLIFGTLLFTLVLAHMLRAFSVSIVQFWEGYWPLELWNRYMKAVEVTGRWHYLRGERRGAIRVNLDSFASIHERLFYGYPSREDRLLPTLLGNTLRASEDYAKTTYGMDAVFWWPRLWLILPEAVQRQIDDSETPMISLLNFATQIGLVTLIGSIYLILQFFIKPIGPAGSIGPIDHWPLWKAILAACTTSIVGFVIAFLIYRSAVSQAKSYGMLIRSAVDLYRFDLLKALHQTLPYDLDAEQKLWDDLVRWIYLNEQENIPPYGHNHDDLGS
jgi:hypothetical protein